MTLFRRIAILSAILSAASVGALTATPALADGNVVCHGGPQTAWKPITALKKQVWLEGWTLQKAQIEGDCYEVYAQNEAGQAVEAFFHPVTLQKLVVFRRGQEVYRAKDFKG